MAFGDVDRYQHAVSQAAKFRARFQKVQFRGLHLGTTPLSEPNWQPLTGIYTNPPPPAGVPPQLGAAPPTEALGEGSGGGPLAVRSAGPDFAGPYEPIATGTTAGQPLAIGPGPRLPATAPQPPNFAGAGEQLSIGPGPPRLPAAYTTGFDTAGAPYGAYPAPGPPPPLALGAGPGPTLGPPTPGPPGPVLGPPSPPPPPGMWQTLAGKGPGGSGLLGRLGYPAAEEGVSTLTRLGGLRGLAGKSLGALAYQQAGQFAGNEFGQGMGATDPLATGGPAALGTHWNPGAPAPDLQGDAKAAAGDVGKNMLIGAGGGAAAGSLIAPGPGTALGAVVGAGIGGIGTAINDIWGQGKAGPEAGAPKPATDPRPPAERLYAYMDSVTLPAALQARVMEGYRDQLAYYKELGAAPDPTDPEGKKHTTDPALMERAAYLQAVQMVPMLKQQAAEEATQSAADDKQHADYIRRATLLQGALAQVAPGLLTPSNYLVPGEFNQASNSLQAIPAMLAMGEAADQQKQYASALQSSSVARTMAALPQSQQDDYDTMRRHYLLQRQYFGDHPEDAPKSTASTNQSATDVIDANK